MGEEFRLKVRAIDIYGGERAIDPSAEEIVFTSSDERVARVDESGLVSVVAGGPVRLTARALGLEASLDARATCAYPANDGVVGPGKVVPPLSWPARRPDGSSFELRLQDVYCDAEWAHVETLALLIYAGWCPYCTQMAKGLADRSAVLNQKGMELLFVLVETDDREPADLDYAWSYLHRLGTVPGFVVADADSRPTPGFFSGCVKGFPTNMVVRTSDMRVITGRQYSGSSIPLESIADDPDANWGLYVQRCGPDDQEAGEPNDRSADATPIGFGLHRGGLCFENDLDVYLVDVEGSWTAQLRWDPERADPMTMWANPVPDDASRAIESSPLRLPGATETLSMSLRGPAFVTVIGKDSLASGPYELEITPR